MSDTTLYKWIKASDELSDDMETVCVRYDNTYGEFFYRAAFYNADKKRYENENISKWNISEIEWLKEIKPVPQSLPVSNVPDYIKLRSIAMADDFMVNKEGAALIYRDIVREFLDKEDAKNNISVKVSNVEGIFRSNSDKEKYLKYFETLREMEAFVMGAEYANSFTEKENEDLKKENKKLKDK